MSWKTTKLGDVLTIQNGYAFDSKSFSNSDGTPLIRIRDLKNGVETKTNYNGMYDDKFLVNAGDLLIGMDGEFGCFEWKGKASLLNQRVCRLMDFSNQLLPRFLFYGINQYLKEIESKTVFITVKHISSKQIKDISFPIPSLPVQKQIVEKLDAAFTDIDKAISATKKNIENVEDLFQKFLFSIFTKENENSILPHFNEILTKTNEYKFQECLVKTKTPKKLKKREYLKEGKFPVVAQEVDMINGYSNDENLLFEVEDKVIIFGDHTRHLKLIDFNFVIGADGVKIIKTIDEINTDYFYYYLLGLMPESRGYARHYKLLKDLIFQIPSLPVQKQIVEKIDYLYKKTKKLVSINEYKLLEFRNLKSSILEQAFLEEFTKDAA